jgi:hypothetical protein
MAGYLHCLRESTGILAQKEKNPQYLQNAGTGAQLTKWMKPVRQKKP